MAGLARSGEVGLLVSASASSVIEVEPEVNVSDADIHALEWKAVMLMTSICAMCSG